MDRVASRAIPCSVTYVDTRCHCWGLEAERRCPLGITNAEKLQLSVFLPYELSMQDWYAGIYGLPTVWPEVSMMGADDLRKVAVCDFHDLRRKYDVRTMWGDLDPQWRLLQSQLVARGHPDNCRP